MLERIDTCLALCVNIMSDLFLFVLALFGIVFLACLTVVIIRDTFFDKGDNDDGDN